MYLLLLSSLFMGVNLEPVWTLPLDELGIYELQGLATTFAASPDGTIMGRDSEGGKILFFNSPQPLVMTRHSWKHLLLDGN